MPSQLNADKWQLSTAHAAYLFWMLVFIESLEGCKPWLSPSMKQQGRGFGKVDLCIATDFTTKLNTLSEATWNIININRGKKILQ